ncbi:hypothetical protein OOK31_19955 [Streptomyces sp. NBC_00249]|uniref:hypothetical protein n=1 Tax=Streptomyces sp. NBC_00249 TaxID=2975690 RepID=UPI00224F9594|nr:hypothetical protein [Streptomyces sp. NBC_00249]MCX5196143.1 hypothetical protein [Streptomyces sp. NBC_00249]
MTTLLRVLLDAREWRDFDVFLSRFTAAASELADLEGLEKYARLTVSEATFERWYYGTGRPHPDSRRVLVHLLGHSIDDLWSPASAPPRAAPAPARHGMSYSAPPGAADGAGLHEMGTNAAMAARRAMAFAMGEERGRVGEETMGYLQDEARRLASAYVRVPLAAVLDDLISVQDECFRLLESGRARPVQLRDLYLIAALSSGMLAKAGHDLGDPNAAMMQARTAAVCAEQADHPAMGAWVRGLQSLISYWADRPTDALHYARQGAAQAASQHGTVTVWLAGLEARAASLIGDADTVTRATRRATDLRETTVPDDLDALGGLLTFPRVRQDYYDVEAHVLLGHGDAQLAQRAERAVGGFSDPGHADWAFGDAAGARTNLGLARLWTGDLDGAAEAVRPVLDLSADQRNAGIIHSARRVRSALLQPGYRDAAVARELREEIETFSRPALALPR